MQLPIWLCVSHRRHNLVPSGTERLTVLGRGPEEEFVSGQGSSSLMVLLPRGTLEQLRVCFIFSLDYDFSSKNNVSSVE